MEIDLKGIIIIVGSYGSGKTEVTINLAVNRKQAGLDVRIADLDLVNPYFRTREAKTSLASLDIEVIVPAEEYLHADLPILSPAIAGMIRQPTKLVLLDTGGDDVGAKVLSTLADPLKDKSLTMLMVVNPFRPSTETVEGCLKMRDEIEAASKLSVGGIIGNANLLDVTKVEDIYEGYDFVNELSKESGLPVKFITAADELLSNMDIKRFSCPVLNIVRQLVPPWKRAANI